VPGEAAVGPHVHHSHNHSDHHDHAHGEGVVWHRHGWGTYHAHQLDFVTQNRPALGVLLALGIAGGILPDPTALALLLAALSGGKVLLGLLTVLVFSLGFAATLVVVGIVAAKAGQRVLEWLSGLWAVRLQIATTLLIIGVGVVLTVQAASKVGALRG
jgi:nickel/cobalt exporter